MYWAGSSATRVILEKEHILVGPSHTFPVPSACDLLSRVSCWKVEKRFWKGREKSVARV